MFKSKNIILYEIIGVIAIFSIIYFIAVNKASYAFSYNETQELYTTRIHLIKKSAEEYANNTLDLFKEKDTIYITVDDLIKAGYLLADEDGKIMDPTSDVKSLNNLKIKLTYKDEKVNAKILS